MLTNFDVPEVVVNLKILTIEQSVAATTPFGEHFPNEARALWLKQTPASVRLVVGVKNSTTNLQLDFPTQ